MSRYIDADKLKSDIKEIARIQDGKLTEFEVLGIMSAQPTADVRENVHAKKVIGGGERDGSTCWFECSHCHGSVGIEDAYCKHCGAVLEYEK